MRRESSHRQRSVVLGRLDEIAFRLVVFLMFAGLRLPGGTANSFAEKYR